MAYPRGPIKPTLYCDLCGEPLMVRGWSCKTNRGAVVPCHECFPEQNEEAQNRISIVNKQTSQEVNREKRKVHG